MKLITAILIASLTFGLSCTKQEPPKPKRWTSSLPMEAPDWTTPEGRAAWPKAMAALRTALTNQEAKVQSMRAIALSGTNTPDLNAELEKQERILAALRKRLNEELANKPTEATR